MGLKQCAKNIDIKEDAKVIFNNLKMYRNARRLFRPESYLGQEMHNTLLKTP